MSLAEVARDYEQYVDSHMPEPERFTITDDGAADWALRKIAQLRTLQVQRAQFVDGKIQELTTWQKQRDAVDEKSITYFTDLLEAYFNELHQSGKLGKRKSWSLPNGTLRVRNTPPKFARDNKKIIKWAEKNAPEVVRNEPKLAWTDLKKRVQITESMQAVDKVTGCLIEGLQVAEPERDEFSVSVIEGGDDA